METILRFKGTENEDDKVAVLASCIRTVREDLDEVVICTADGPDVPVNATFDDVVTAWAFAVSAPVINHE